MGKVTRKATNKRKRLLLGFQLIVYFVYREHGDLKYVALLISTTGLTQGGRHLVPHRPVKTWGRCPGSRPVLVAQFHGWGRLALYFRLQSAPPGTHLPTHTIPPTMPAPPIE